MIYILYGLTFVSGACSIIFELLWFYVAGNALGHSILSTSIVMASFMLGLAFGSMFSGTIGDRIKRPLRTYAYIEAIVALTGLSFTLYFPGLLRELSFVFHGHIDNHFYLECLKFIISLVFMVLPSTAIGATLPILVKTLSERNPSYARVMASLYGTNTLGAFAGAVICEGLLIKWLGINGAGAVSSGALMLVSIISFVLSFVYHEDIGLTQTRMPLADFMLVSVPRRTMLSISSFISGMLFLALEVLWFRFIVLFYNPYSVMFGVIVSIILLGIGAGGLVSSYFLTKRQARYILTPSALLSGLLVTATYWGCYELNVFSSHYLLAAMYLIFPVSFISGVTLSAIGRALFSQEGSEASTTGTLIMFNTLGAAAGAIVGGFVLVPLLGIEKSFFTISLSYLFLAALTVNYSRVYIDKRMKLGYIAGASVLIAVLFAFPFGEIQSNVYNRESEKFSLKGFDVELVAQKEGLSDTMIYLRYNVPGKEAYFYRLVTNNHSMSATDPRSRRYMKHYVYLPVAINPNIRKALLLGFGTGSTAKAMTDNSRLEHIDIVEISEEVIDLSRVLYQYEENPINDKRVKVHIEDARFFVQASDDSYDLITSEPPPPKGRGVFHLYTQEYFRSLYGLLNKGGVVTYWLPVNQMMFEESKSIVKAFCNVFKDCSLWDSAGYNLMLMGTRELEGGASLEEFERQWKDPVVSMELKALGFESPAQMATLLKADTEQLMKITMDNQPLTDNYPMRLYTDFSYMANFQKADYTKEAEAWDRYLPSPIPVSRKNIIKKFWPGVLADEADRFSRVQEILNRTLIHNETTNLQPYLHEILSTSDLEFPVLWLMGTDRDMLGALKRAEAKGIKVNLINYYLAAEAVSMRDYDKAEGLFATYQRSTVLPETCEILSYRIHMKFMSGRAKEAQPLMGDFIDKRCDYISDEYFKFLYWARNTFEAKHGRHSSASN